MMQFEQGGIPMPSVRCAAAGDESQPVEGNQTQMIGSGDLYPRLSSGDEGGELAMFHAFARTCAAIAATASKLQKIRVLAEYLKALNSQNVTRAAIWFTGSPFAGSEN